MDEPKSMKILEICRVAPNDPPTKFSLPLTFLDHIWLSLNPTSRLLFFELPQEKYDSSILLAKLKSSLSYTLHHYLPLAGELTWPQESERPVVQYKTGDGVSLVIAETRSDFNSLSGNEFRDSDVLYPFLPEFPTSETQSPVITLQITLFPNSGFCIGYIAHHAIMDGKSVSMFLRSWAHICKNGVNSILPLELTPNLDRDFVKQQEELQGIFPKSMGKKVDPESRALTTFDMTPLPDTMIGTFILSRENIDTLKKSVLAYWEKKNKLEKTSRVSTFVVSTAYALVCLNKGKKNTAENIFLGINVNGRTRLDPPLPPNYFGNCVVWCGGWGNTIELSSRNGFFVAVDLITEALALLNDRVVESMRKMKDLTVSMPKEFVMIGIAGSPQFELYKADFGWGKPKKVEMISIDKGSSFYLSDDREGNGGIEIGVAMKKHETGEFASVFTNEIQHPCLSIP